MRIYPRAGCYLRRTVPGQKYHSLMIIRMRIPMLRWSAPCREEDAFHLVFSLVMLICAVASLVTWFVLWGRKGVIPEESYHPLLWISLFTASVGTWFFTEAYVWAISTGSFAASGTLNYLALSLMPLSLLGVLNSICSEKLASLKSRRAAPAGPPGGRTWFQSAGSWWCSGPRAG